MLLYLLKRLLAMIPTLLGITLVTFIIINLAPGNPIDTQFGQGGSEKSAEGGAGSSSNKTQGQEEQQAKLKAKKELLGMVEKYHTLYQWSPEFIQEELHEGIGETPKLAPGTLGPEMGNWAQTLTTSPDGQTVFAATKTGTIHRFDSSLIIPPDSAGFGVFDSVAGLLGDDDIAPLFQAESWHEVAIYALEVSPDGTQLLSADVDGWLARWDAQTGALLATQQVSEAWIRDLEYLPSGDRVLVASDDGRLRVLDATTLAETESSIKTRRRVYKMLIQADGERVWTVGGARQLEEWSLTTGEKLREGFPHPQVINDMALSPDGKTLATAGDDRQIRLLDTSGSWESEPAEFAEHWKAVTRVLWSEDGALLYSGSEDETVRIWDGSSGAELGRSDKIGTVYSMISLSGGILTTSNSYSDVNLVRQYGNWLGRMMKFDYGRSMSDDELVIDKMKKALPVTIGLNLIAIIIIYIVSIPMGVYAAVKRNGWFDQVSSIVLFLLYSIPNFWLASLLIMGFATVPCWLHDAPMPPDDICTEMGERAESDAEWTDDQDLFCAETIEDRDSIQTASICLSLHESYSDFDHCRTNLDANIDEIIGDKPRYEAQDALAAADLSSEDRAAVEEVLDFHDGSHWDVLPSGGLESIGAEKLSYLDWLWDRIKHLFLPILVMTYAGFASLSRYARTTMLETIQEDYVRTARAKGLSERVVVFKHAFRNSLVTIVTLMGNLLPALIGGSVIVEYIFNIEGMGLLGFNAILARDYPVIMAITTFSAFLTLLGILLSDILYSVVDPRVSQD